MTMAPIPATDSLPEPPRVAGTAAPSSTAYSTPTASAGSPLTGVLAGLSGAQLEDWHPDDSSAENAIASVNRFCQDYCPARLSCVEDKCRLYRLEGRAMDHLGYVRNPATEAVGVVGQSIIGL